MSQEALSIVLRQVAELEQSARAELHLGHKMPENAARTWSDLYATRKVLERLAMSHAQPEQAGPAEWIRQQFEQELELIKRFRSDHYVNGWIVGFEFYQQLLTTLASEPADFPNE